MIIHNLFPTSVGKFELGRKFTEEELEFINKQPITANSGNTTSSDNYLFKSPEMGSIVEFVDKCLDEYFQETVKPKEDVKLRITQSWSNYTKPGEYHHKHEHPNSFISGVLYVNADPEKDKIYFYKNGYSQISIPPSEWNIHNSSSWWLEAATGVLYLFPSSTTHMVQTVDANETRVSIAFNTFPVGYVGEDSSLTGLRL